MRAYDPTVRYTDVTAPLYAEAADLDDVDQDAVRRPATPGCAATSWSRPTGCPWRTRWSCGCRSWTGRSSRSPRAAGRAQAAAAVVDTKYALRRALRRLVPPAIVNRKKLGFPTPDPGVAARRDVRLGAATSSPRPARATCSTSGTSRSARRAQARRGRPLPQGLDGPGVLHLARHLRGAQPRSGVGRAQSALLTKPGRRVRMVRVPDAVRASGVDHVTERDFPLTSRASSGPRHRHILHPQRIGYRGAGEPWAASGRTRGRQPRGDRDVRHRASFP